MTPENGAKLTRWADMPKEQLNSLLQRRMITGVGAMLTQIFLKKGCIVPLHQHENEQFSYVLEGRLRFRLNSEQGEETIVGAGEVLYLPSDVPHMAEALEDTMSLDIFSPPRQDWLNGTDNYLREK